MSFLTASDALIADIKLLAASLLLLSASSLPGLPVDVVERLSADAFREREAAQADLLEWADKHGDGSTDELLDLWETSEDPEIRERTLEVLRKLSDKAYQKEGKPYIGISMTEEIDAVDEKGVGRIGIAVTEILIGSPAASSELLAGDVIIAMNGTGWEEPGVVDRFSESIAEMKSGSEVVLLVKRAEVEPFEVKVTLRRCPVPNLMPGMGDLGKLELKAEEAFFKEWLAEKRNAKK